MTPNLRIKILHFRDGIGQLGGRMSLSSEVTPGVPRAESIKRLPGGYLVGWDKKLFVIPDSMVACVLVEDMESSEVAEPVPAAKPEPAPAKPAPRFSEAEVAARTALEERKRIAEERVKAKAESLAQEMA
jgi:hypothetical protein